MARFKRAPLGYSPEEVDAALAAYDLRITELEQERDRARAALEIAESQYEGSDQLGGLIDRIDEIQAQARGQATRIRMLALKEAAEVNRRVRELADRAAERVSPSPPAAPAAGIPEGSGATVSAIGQGGISSRLFDGLVRLDVGPLRDFSQLAALQDGIELLPSAGAVSIEGVANGRATIAVTLTAATDLMAEMARIAEPGATVRSLGPGRLTVELPAAARRRAA